MWLHPRLEVQGPDPGWRPWRVHLRHGSDEYGNGSLYLKTALFYLVVFPYPRFQRDVELPELGECPWVDATWYREVPPLKTRRDKE